MLNRQANFKISTATDSKQDAEISTLSTTISGTISPNQIKLGGANKVLLKSEGGGQLTISGSNLNVGDCGLFVEKSIITPDFISVDSIYSVNDAYLGTKNNFNTSLLHIKNDTNQIVSETNASISGINEITCSKLYYSTLEPAIPTPSKSLLTFYVDGSCGADVNDGSREKPFRLIQSAINKCEQVWDGTAREVKVAFGSYSENLTISKARIQLTGSVCSRYANTACNISGTITLQIADTVDMFNSQVFITGFQIVGSVIDASSSVHTLSIKDCYLYNQENIIQQRTRGAEILNNGASFNPPKYNVVDCRTYLENLTINASNALGTNALVSIEAGNVEAILCTITAKSANTNCLQMVYNASTSLFTQSSFTNDNSGSALKPLIYVYSIFGNPTLNTFNNCGFVFGSTTVKSVSQSGSNSAIVCKNTNDYFNVMRCTFILQGVSSQSQSNFIIMPLYTESKTLRYSESGNIASFGTANKICPYGVIPLAFTTVS
jgi:hypothetical protein